MNTFKGITGAVLNLGLLTIPAWGAEYSRYSTEELAATSGTMRSASVQQRNALSQEWQNRVRSMTQKEPAYMGRQASALSGGSRYGYSQRRGRGQGVCLFSEQGGGYGRRGKR
jgi:hypothetical protein